MHLPSSPLSSPAQSSQGELSQSVVADLCAAPPPATPSLGPAGVESNISLGCITTASAAAASVAPVAPAEESYAVGCPLLSWHQDPQEFDYLPFDDLQPIDTAGEPFGSVTLKEEPEMAEVTPTLAAAPASCKKSGTSLQQQQQHVQHQHQQEQLQHQHVVNSVADDRNDGTSVGADADSCDDSAEGDEDGDLPLATPPQTPTAPQLKTEPTEVTDIAAGLREADLEEDAIVTATVARLLREARSNAQAAKLSLRNTLKADLRSKHSALSATERGKLRSRREAAVSRQNKVEYANQLEATLQRLVRENHRLRRSRANPAYGCADVVGASPVIFKAK